MSDEIENTAESLGDPTHDDETVMNGAPSPFEI